MGERTWNGVQASMRCWWCRLPIGDDPGASMRFGVIKGRCRVGVPLHDACEDDWYDWDDEFPAGVRPSLIPAEVDRLLDEARLCAPCDRQHPQQPEERHGYWCEHPERERICPRYEEVAKRQRARRRTP